MKTQMKSASQQESRICSRHGDSQRTQKDSQSQPRNSDRKLLETNKRFEEATSTSLRGRHHLVGHYEAALQDTELITGYALVLNMPVNTGFSPRRWQQATSVMLEKDKGDPKYHLLRIINLFEADYNLFLILIWGSCLVGKAEK